MDFSLRCNSLKCRGQLTDRAVVTTCSHIFCVPCSESLGLAHPNGNVRVCPACETQLSNPDDVVVTHLNPTEDYKTSVLSGLSPTIIMECAGRGLSFYSYQTTQEIMYQEFLARSLTDKYSTLSSQMDQMIHDANSEITSLREKIKSIGLEKDSLLEKYNKLAASYKEQNKGKQSIQRMYNTLKQQQQAAGIEIAADHDAEHVLENAHHAAFNPRGSQQQHGRAGSTGSAGSRGRQPVANLWQEPVLGSRTGMQSARSAPVAMTPSGVHRTRLDARGYANSAATGVENVHQGTPLRTALGSMHPNVYRSGAPAAAYGPLSGGVKMARPHQGPINRNGYGAGRPGAGAGLNYR